MSRYIRLNTLPGFTSVASFYWFDANEVQACVLSFHNKDNLFNPNCEWFTHSQYVIGSHKAGDVRYNFVLKNSYHTQSAHLQKIMRAYKFSAREITNKDKCQEVAAQKEDVATVAMPDVNAKFAVINMSNYTLVAHGQDEATACENIERLVRDDGGEYMLLQQVAIAKASKSVVWI